MTIPKLTIEEFATLIGLCGVAVSCVSLSYEFGYASGIGISLSDLSLGAEDLARSADSWAPSLFIGISVLFLLETSTSFLERGKSDAEIINSSAKPELMRKIRHSPDFGFLALGIILLWQAILGLPPSKPPIGYYLYVGIWQCLAGFIITRDVLHRKFNPKALLGIYFFVSIILLAHASGQTSAFLDLLRKPQDEITLSSDVKIQCNVLRRYSKVTLVVKPGETEVTLLADSEVRSIRRASKMSATHLPGATVKP